MPIHTTEASDAKRRLISPPRRPTTSRSMTSSTPMAATRAIQAVGETFTGGLRGVDGPRRFLRPRVAGRGPGTGHRGRAVLTGSADGILPFDSFQPSAPGAVPGERSGTPYLETVRQNTMAHTAATIAAMTQSVEPITPTIERISPT